MTFASRTYSLVGAFSVIVQPVVEPMDRFTALLLLLLLGRDLLGEECLDTRGQEAEQLLARSKPRLRGHLEMSHFLVNNSTRGQFNQENSAK